MQLEVGIALIVIGFLIPIVLFLVYRRYKRLKLEQKIKEGEIFDKECERVGIVEDGKRFQVKLPLARLKLN
jgi:hypothetical protein